MRQLLADYEDPLEVNTELEKIGYNIGTRLIDDFLSKTSITKCTSFHDTSELIAYVGFRMFLNVQALVGNWSNDRKTFSLVFEHNPLSEFVELPKKWKETLWYSNVLCGVVRGAVEMVNMKVECWFVRDMLRGDDMNEIRVSLKEVLTEAPPKGDD